jgi:iron(III) transport system substrate-binding protein
LTQAAFLRKKRLVKISVALLFLVIVVGATIFAYRSYIWPERKLVLYTSMDEQYVSKWAAEFQKETGIKVEYYIDGTQALISRLIAEKRGPNADVMWGGGPDAYIRAKDEGLLVPYTPATIAQLKEFEGTVNMRDKDWYWYPYSYSWFGFAINTGKVPQGQEPKTWEDLLDPKWQGKIDFASPVTTTTGYQGISMIIQYYIARLKSEDAGWKAAWDYIAKLGQNIRKWPDNGWNPTYDTAKGEIALGTAWEYMPLTQAAKGLPCDQLLLDYTQIGASIIALTQGPHVSEGKAFIDFVLSQKGQQLLVDQLMKPPIIQGVPLPKGWRYTYEQVLGRSINYDFVWSAANDKKIKDQWKALFG